jgi:hypothetical protein
MRQRNVLGVAEDCPLGFGSKGITVTVDFRSKDFSARCADLRAQYQWAIQRHAELIEMQRSIRQRRAQVRVDRERLHFEAATRLTSRRAMGRAAAAILEAAVRAADVPMMELWIDYFALGGNGAPGDLAAMVEGRAPIDSYTHDLIAVALNERLIDRGLGPFLAYWDGGRAG